RKLLDRQIELLRYLTGAELIFGAGSLADVAQDSSLRGMKISLLRLEAEMSFTKRISKIREALPQTFAHLGSQRERILRGFVAAYPPQTFRRYDEARCFYDFLQRQWETAPP